MTAQNNPIRLSDLAKRNSLLAKDIKQHTTSVPSRNTVSSSLKYGQKMLLKQLPLYKDKPARILEIGCGNGELLDSIAEQHSKTTLIGIDKETVSLKKEQDIELQQLDFEQQILPFENMDIVVLSYTLCQTSDWEALLEKAYAATRSNGYIAVVDFHNTNFTPFRQRMTKQAIHMDGTLLPLLRRYYTEHYQKVASVLGMWDYFVFVGRKDPV